MGKASSYLATLAKHSYYFARYAASRRGTPHPCMKNPGYTSEVVKHIPTIRGYIYAECEGGAKNVLGEKVKLKKGTFSSLSLEEITGIYESMDRDYNINKAAVNLHRTLTLHAPEPSSPGYSHPSSSSPKSNSPRSSTPGPNYGLQDVSYQTPDKQYALKAPHPSPVANPFARYPLIEGAGTPLDIEVATITYSEVYSAVGATEALEKEPPRSTPSTPYGTPNK